MTDAPTRARPTCRCGHTDHNWGMECDTFGCGCRESVQPFDPANGSDGFVYAGRVSVGFVLHSCVECGATVEGTARTAHREWHDARRGSTP